MSTKRYVCDKCGGEGVKLWRGVHGCKDENGYELLCAACLAPGEVVDDKGALPMPEVRDDYRSDQIKGWLPAVPSGDTYWGYSSVPQRPLQWWLDLPTYGATEETIEQARHPATDDQICPRCKEVRGQNDFTYSKSGACRQCEHADFCGSLYGMTFAAVEANGFETMTLWAENQKTKKVKWEQINEGTMATVGELAGKPVCVSVNWARLNGLVVMFYDPCSVVVDHEMIEEYLKKKVGARWNSTNAMNFHNTLEDILRCPSV